MQCIIQNKNEKKRKKFKYDSKAYEKIYINMNFSHTQYKLILIFK